LKTILSSILVLFILTYCNQNRVAPKEIVTIIDTTFLPADSIIKYLWIDDGYFNTDVLIMEFINDSVVRQYSCLKSICKNKNVLWEVNYNGYRFTNDSLCLIRNLLARENNPTNYYLSKYGNLFPDYCTGYKCYLKPPENKDVIFKIIMHDNYSFEYRILNRNELDLHNITDKFVYEDN
jgi:hypothetical protein